MSHGIERIDQMNDNMLDLVDADPTELENAAGAAKFKILDLVALAGQSASPRRFVIPKLAPAAELMGHQLIETPICRC